MDSDTSVVETVAKVGGSGGAGALLLFLIQRFFKKEDKEDAQTAATLQDIQHSLSTLSGRFDVFIERISTQANALAELKERLDGVSSNHGKRISEIEISIARIEARAEAK